MRLKAANIKKDLVVSIACIIFLLANIAAVGQRGHRHAKQILCLSNLQKWGQCFHAYAADNDGFFMEGWAEVACQQTAPHYKHYWMEALRPYYGNVHKLRCCPEAAIPGTELGLNQWGGNGTFTAWGVFDGSWYYVVPGDYGSYTNNAYICNPPPCATIIQGHLTEWNWRTANVHSADTIPLMGDGQWTDAWPHHSEAASEYDGQPWMVDHAWQMLRVCINRHSSNVCWVFLDGHARTVGLKELWKIKWHRNFDINGGPTGNEWPLWMRDFTDY